jgi:hypothetical protein
VKIPSQEHAWNSNTATYLLLFTKTCSRSTGSVPGFSRSVGSGLFQEQTNKQSAIHKQVLQRSLQSGEECFSQVFY